MLWSTCDIVGLTCTKHTPTSLGREQSYANLLQAVVGGDAALVY